jgi:hypothetical protein
MGERLALSIVGAIFVIVAFLIFVPVVPFEQLQAAQVPANSWANTQFLCSRTSSGLNMCRPGAALRQVWVTSYGSFAFEAFHIGTSPYASPVKVTIGGITNVYVLNASGFVVETLAYPSSVKNEPVPLVSVVSTTLFSSPLEAGILSIKLVNNGVNENATVSITPTASQVLVTGSQTIAAGQSATYNVTSWTEALPPPKAGDDVNLEISGYVCYGQDCYSYQNNVTSKVAPSPGTAAQPTVIRLTSGPVWLVGAASTDRSAIPNTGVRSTIQVINTLAPGPLAFWVGDGLSNNLWGQVGYSMSGGGTPVGFYQVWNLTSDVLVASGSTSVNVGNRTFSMYLQNGTTWAFAIDGNVFASFDMGASSSSSTFPVYVLSEEQGNTTFSFPAVSFYPAMEVLKSGSWSPVLRATSYGSAWGVKGNIQDGLLRMYQLVVGGSAPQLPLQSLLWGSYAITPASDSLVPTVVPAVNLHFGRSIRLF